MEKQEQPTVGATPKKGKGKLMLISIIVALLLGGGGYFYLMGGSSAPSIKLIPYQSAEKWGYIDKEGKILINPQFNYATVFTGGLALVQSSESKFGFIDEEGKYKINATYKSALPFSEGLACVVPENGKPQFINDKGDVKFTATTGEICGSFTEGLARVKVGDKWGYLDMDGNMKINPQFDNANIFSEGLACVSQTDKEKHESLYGYINNKGEIVINYQFKSASIFSDGLAQVSDGKKWGYVDKNGKYSINPQFDYAGEFKKGCAAIQQGRMYGYIDNQGKLTINPQFNSVSEFSDNGLAYVYSSDGKVGYIDKEGKYKVNPQFENGTKFYGDIAFVQSANKWGIIDKDGKYLVNPQFDQININYENYKYSQVASDYFDMAGIVQIFLDGTTAQNFRGIGTNTTYEEINGKIPLQLSGNNYAYNQTPEILNDKTARTMSQSFNFKEDVAVSQPQYRQEMRYDYWKGNHYENVLSGYAQVLNNPKATVNNMGYSIELFNKGNEKVKDVYVGMRDEIYNKIESKTDNIKNNESTNVSFGNDNMTIGISYNTYRSNQGDNRSSISISVEFRKFENSALGNVAP